MSTVPRAACVIGWPVGHSRSPLIHNYWLKLYGIAGEYRREAVPPQNFAAFIGSLAARGYGGANVTVPHKEAALALAQPDALAAVVGFADIDPFVLNLAQGGTSGISGAAAAAAILIAASSNNLLKAGYASVFGGGRATATSAAALIGLAAAGVAIAIGMGMS